MFSRVFNAWISVGKSKKLCVNSAQIGVATSRGKRIQVAHWADLWRLRNVSRQDRVISSSGCNTLYLHLFVMLLHSMTVEIVVPEQGCGLHLLDLIGLVMSVNPVLLL